jgi:hypothetical protein
VADATPRALAQPLGPIALLSHKGHLEAMVSGALAAGLKELHADCLVLADNTTIPLAPGLIPPRIPPGSRVTLLRRNCSLLH